MFPTPNLEIIHQSTVVNVMHYIENVVYLKYLLSCSFIPQMKFDQEGNVTTFGKTWGGKHHIP